MEVNNKLTWIILGVLALITIVAIFVITSEPTSLNNDENLVGAVKEGIPPDEDPPGGYGGGGSGGGGGGTGW